MTTAPIDSRQCPAGYWDEPTSRGPRRRPVMHMIGLRVTPEEFTPPTPEADFDEDGIVGLYYPDEWEIGPAATILEAIAALPREQAVLIATWEGGGGQVSLLGPDEINLNPNDGEPLVVSTGPRRQLTRSRGGYVSTHRALASQSC